MRDEMNDTWVCACGKETDETHWHYDEQGKVFHIDPEDLPIEGHGFRCRCALVQITNNEVNDENSLSD